MTGAVVACSLGTGISGAQGIPATPARGPQLVPVAFPAAGMAFAGLDAIACPTASDCFAVGTGGGVVQSEAPFIAHWLGRSWTVMASPKLATDSSLDSIACSSETDCMAVGRLAHGTTATTLAEQWNGASWARVATPRLEAGGNGFNLDGVSCPAPTECFAVGGDNLGTSSAHPLIERWNGNTWFSAAPASVPADGYFNAVSCLSVNHCWAVGYSRSGVLVQHWDGYAWTTSSASGVRSGPALDIDTVSCRAAAMCWAGGQAGSGEPLLLRFERGAWHSVTATALPTMNGAIGAVDCASPDDCWAVGGTASAAMAANFNGTSWSRAQTRTPAAATAYLAGVACPSTKCVAVGFYGSSTAEAGLVEMAR
jgi:hypothetical protein